MFTAQKLGRKKHFFTHAHQTTKNTGKYTHTCTVRTGVKENYELQIQ